MNRKTLTVFVVAATLSSVGCDEDRKARPSGTTPSSNPPTTLSDTSPNHNTDISLDRSERPKISLNSFKDDSDFSPRRG